MRVPSMSQVHDTRRPRQFQGHGSSVEYIIIIIISKPNNR